jgi:hypothetical protein
MTKSHQILGTLALALVLAACGKSEAPAEAPSAEAAPAPMVEEPKPAEGFTTEVAEVPPIVEVVKPSPSAAPATISNMIAPNVPNHEDRRFRKAIDEVPAALLGGQVQDVGEEDANQRAFRALYAYLARKRIPSETFYLKYYDKDAGYWTFMFFGIPWPNEGLYVYVRIFPDGRAEIVD